MEIRRRVSRPRSMRDSVSQGESGGGGLLGMGADFCGGGFGADSGGVVEDGGVGEGSGVAAGADVGGGSFDGDLKEMDDGFGVVGAGVLEDVAGAEESG